MQLMIDGKPAEVGMKVKDFRGEEHTLVGWREPHKSSSTGRVYCKTEGKEYTNEWFPGVIGGKFV